MSHPIALPACQLLGPTFPYHYISAVCSRRPAACGFASESHLRSPGEISGLPVARPAEHAPGRANLECRCRVLHAASQYRRSTCKPPSDRSLRSERRTVTTLPSSRADQDCSIPVLFLRVERPCVVGAVQVAPTPRIGPRDVQRYGGSEAHQAGIGRGSVWACCAQKVLAKSGIFAW